MSADALLQSCRKVRQTGTGKWVACCPSHDDRSPSLAVTECDDGRVLVYCFAGCETEDVLTSLGLTFSDLMPEHIGGKHSTRSFRQRFDARQVIATLDHESLVVAIIGTDFLRHRAIDEMTWTRLATAVSRINSARAICAPARIGK